MKHQARSALADNRPLGRAPAAPASVVVVNRVSELEKDGNPQTGVILVAVETPSELEQFASFARSHTHCRLVALTYHNDTAYCDAAKAAGFWGVVDATLQIASLFEAISAVAAGRQHFIEDTHTHVDVMQLSPRERQVLTMLSDGDSTKKIAANLTLSGKTIETHRLRIMRKLKIFSVSELTKYAVRNGLGRL